MIRRLLKLVWWLSIILVVIIVVPVGTVETMCRGDTVAQSDPVYITAPEDRRPEARTYLTYPEWHIVFAYEGYAEVVQNGSPHEFPYAGSVWRFWQSLCRLTPEADALGAAGIDAKMTIYTIGVSFTIEMALKGLYEETIGRVFSIFNDVSPQDEIEAAMASDYAAFLQQTPWYQYDFGAQIDALWAPEAEDARGWERRLALGLEWGAKAQYARLIGAAAGGLGADELTMKVALDRVPDPETAGLENLRVLSTGNSATLAEVDRYRVFTTLVQRLSETEVNILEIAGNDEILVSLLSETEEITVPDSARIISATERDGFDDRRIIVVTPVNALLSLVRGLDSATELEHIYDY